MTFEIEIKTPSDCSKREFENFCSLVERGGEVDPYALREGVERALKLTFLRVDGELVSVGAIKKPTDGYKRSILRKAKPDLDLPSFRYEFGYAFTDEAHRGNHYASKVAAELLPLVSEAIFGTSTDDKAAMHAVLTKNRFVRSGEPYPSVEHPGKSILLFVRT